jgi:hypothetical protein
MKRGSATIEACVAALTLAVGCGGSSDAGGTDSGAGTMKEGGKDAITSTDGSGGLDASEPTPEASAGEASIADALTSPDARGSDGGMDGAGCPATAPRPTGLEMTPQSCAGTSTSQVCEYPSEPCPNAYFCQCVEGLGGPATCYFTPGTSPGGSLVTCVDAGDAMP